nr:venom protein [Lampona murina]
MKNFIILFVLITVLACYSSALKELTEEDLENHELDGISYFSGTERQLPHVLKKFGDLFAEDEEMTRAFKFFLAIIKDHKKDDSEGKGENPKKNKS